MAGQTLNPDSATPLYEQLAALLRAEIESGRIEPDHRIPSEHYLEQQYGVSRDTVRRAFQLLRDEGLVVTVRGKGTFVRPAK